MVPPFQFCLASPCSSARGAQLHSRTFISTRGLPRNTRIPFQRPACARIMRSLWVPRKTAIKPGDRLYPASAYCSGTRQRQVNNAGTREKIYNESLASKNILEAFYHDSWAFLNQNKNLYNIKPRVGVGSISWRHCAGRRLGFVRNLGCEDSKIFGA